jgi:hypothetical protein
MMEQDGGQFGTGNPNVTLVRRAASIFFKICPASRTAHFLKFCVAEIIVIIIIINNQTN